MINGYEEINNKRLTIINELKHLGTLTENPALFARALDIQKGIFKLLVLGEFKNGKSTLLNSLLGEKILPAKSTPCTAVITSLVYGNDKNVSVYKNLNSSPQIIPFDEFKEKFKLTEEDIDKIEGGEFIDRFKDISYVELQCESPICKNGVKIIDSPGLKEHASRTKVTMNYLKEAHAVIFVLNATKILTKDEKEFIEETLWSKQQTLENIFFVVNRINQINSTEVDEIKSWVHDALINYYGNNEAIYSKRVFFVNAKGGEGILEFETALEEFLTSEDKGLWEIKSSLSVLRPILKDSLQKIEDERRAMLKPVEELEENRLQTGEIVVELQKEKEEIQNTINRFCTVIENKIYSSLISYINNMKSNWSIECKEINLDEVSIINVLKNSGSREKISGDIQKEISKYLEKRLKYWSEEIILKEIENDIEKMSLELNDQIGHFEIGLQNIYHIFTEGTEINITDMVEADKEGRLMKIIFGFNDFKDIAKLLGDKHNIGDLILEGIKQALTACILFTIIGGPLGIVVFAALQSFNILMAQNKFKDALLKNICENLYEEFQKNLPKKREEIFYAVETEFSMLSNGIIHVLESQIEDAKNRQDNILKMKKEKSFSVSQETTRLDNLALAIKNSFNIIWKTLNKE